MCHIIVPFFNKIGTILLMGVYQNGTKWRNSTEIGILLCFSFERKALKGKYRRPGNTELKK
jgi:hypothetical protein